MDSCTAIEKEDRELGFWVVILCIHGPCPIMGTEEQLKLCSLINNARRGWAEEEGKKRKGEDGRKGGRKEERKRRGGRRK